jgi:hypothetical protein
LAGWAAGLDRLDAALVNLFDSIGKRLTALTAKMERDGDTVMTKRAQNLDPTYQVKVVQYQRLVQSIPKVECKGAANPYTSVNGHMFSYLHPSGAMALKLPQSERDRFLRDHETTLFRAYGIVQKEYVTVPDSLLSDTTRLKKYFRMSYDYASALKPKAKAKR